MEKTRIFNPQPRQVPGRFVSPLTNDMNQMKYNKNIK